MFAKMCHSAERAANLTAHCQQRSARSQLSLQQRSHAPQCVHGSVKCLCVYMSSKQSDTLQTITLHCTMQSMQRYFVMDKVHRCLPSTDAGSERLQKQIRLWRHRSTWIVCNKEKREIWKAFIDRGEFAHHLSPCIATGSTAAMCVSHTSLSSHKLSVS